MKIRVKIPAALCAVPECERDSYAKGLCKTHGNQMRTKGVLTPIRLHERGKYTSCQFEGCERPLSARGYCSAHYDQVRMGRELRSPRHKAKKGSYGSGCLYHGCGKPNIALGLCSQHYGRGVSQYARDGILELQGGQCLCTVTVPGKTGWHLDHSHDCTKDHGSDTYCGSCVRGLLCYQCNVQGIAWYEIARARGMEAIPVLERWVNRRFVFDGDVGSPDVRVTMATATLSSTGT